VQIAETDTDEDHTDVDIEVTGEGFPSDPTTPFYCQVGDSYNPPYEFRVTTAIIINSTNIICQNVS
jgi:hypothetical protein